MKKIIFLGLGLVLLAAACNKQTTEQNPPANNNQQTSDQTTSGELPIPNPDTGNSMDTIPPQIVTVNMTATGFQPQNVTVKVGTTVVFKNTDTAPHWPASAPHPQHTDLPGFDALKPVPAESSYSFTFTKVGTWKYHDHLKSSLYGSVTVTQ